VLREIVADAGRVDVQDVEAMTIRHERRDDSAARVRVRPRVLADDFAAIGDHEHRLVLTWPRNVEAGCQPASLVGGGTAGGVLQPG
jgi:hypothetical protein